MHHEVYSGIRQSYRIGEGHQSKPGSSQGPKPRQAQVINTHYIVRDPIGRVPFGGVPF